MDAQEQRIAAIVGDDEESTFDDSMERFYHHLTKSLQLPCKVTGTEYFRWEERYVIGPGERSR